MALDIILQILSLLFIVVGGALVVVLVTELILMFFEGDKKTKNKKDDTKGDVVDNDDVVVYKNKQNPNEAVKTAEVDEAEEKEEKKIEPKENAPEIQKIDFDKAIEEQKALNASLEKEQTIEEPEENEDDKFQSILDEVSVEAMAEYKESKKAREREEAERLEREKAEKEAEEKAKREALDKEEEAKRKEEARLAEEKLEAIRREQEEIAKQNAEKEAEIERLRAEQDEYLKEKQAEIERLRKEQADINEVKKLQEEILAEKEEIAKLKQELLDKQQELDEQDKKRKEEEAKRIEELNRLQQEAQEVLDQEPEIRVETVVDDTEINRLKRMNLTRMDNRLNNILRETERMQEENERKRAEAIAKIGDENHKSKYSLNKAEPENDVVIIEDEKTEKAEPNNATQTVTHEQVVVTEEHVHYTTNPTTAENTVAVANKPNSDDDSVKEIKPEDVKPSNERSYYENNLAQLQVELKDAEKELKRAKAEYIPLSRIYKAYNRDTDKLRRKEMIVAKQKIALYGVNSAKVDPAKKQKLDDNIKDLAELKDSVAHCKAVIDRNHERYPILEKNYEIINKQIKRLNDDIAECERAIAWFENNK